MTRPLSSIKIRLRAWGVFKLSELISPRLELLSAEPGPIDRDDRTKSPLLSLGRSGSLEDCLTKARFGLELAYLIGDDSGAISIGSRTMERYLTTE